MKYKNGEIWGFLVAEEFYFGGLPPPFKHDEFHSRLLISVKGK